MKEEIVKKLIECAQKAFKKKIDGITGDSNITEEFGTNSMKRIAMCALIENEFEVIIPVSAFGSYATFNDLADHVMSGTE